MTAAARLRELVARPGITVLPGAYDALSARLVEQAGFDAVYLSGAGVAYTQLAQPDLGLVSLGEMVERARVVTSAVGIPVLADADTGFGNALNVQRTVRSYERTGVAGIQLEDQTFPKRCGHLDGKSVIPAEEMAAKIRAARDAACDLVIVARTDAAATHGFDEAVERCRLYAEAGADVVFADALATADQVREFPRRVSRPAMANVVEGGRTPSLPVEDLAAAGYRIAVYPNSLVRLFARQGLDLLQALRANGGTSAWSDRMLTFDELNELVGTPDLLERARGYDATAEPRGGPAS